MSSFADVFAEKAIDKKINLDSHSRHSIRVNHDLSDIRKGNSKKNIKYNSRNPKHSNSIKGRESAPFPINLQIIRRESAPFAEI